MREAQPEQRQEAAHERTSARHRAPQRDAGREDGAPAATVGEPADRHGHEHIKEAERRPHEHSEFEITELQVLLDGLDQQARQKPIDVRDELRRGEQQHDVPGVAKAALRQGALAQCISSPPETFIASPVM
jgi:hypothetical protein